MLEIIALNPEDIRQAARGGADRVELVGTMDADGLSPDHEQLHRAVVEAKKAGIAIRVMLRKRAGFLFEQTDQQALLQLISELCENGADGVVLGFLDRFGNIDHSAISSLELVQMPVTFHRAIDAATDYFGAWEQLAQLAGRADFNLTQVLTAGSIQGVNAGLENILAAAKNPFAQNLIMAGGGLAQKHLPLLQAAGISAFHVGSAVRPDRNWSRPVAAELVRKWAELIS